MRQTHYGSLIDMSGDVSYVRTSEDYCLQVNYHLKLVNVWGVPEKFPCVVIANSLI